MKNTNTFVEMPFIQPIPVSLEIRLWRRKPGEKYDPNAAVKDLKITLVGVLLVIMALWAGLS